MGPTAINILIRHHARECYPSSASPFFFFFFFFLPSSSQALYRRWSAIAAHLPGRTDNEIKNYWNTHFKKRRLRMGINPDTYAPTAFPSSPGPPGGGGASSSSAFPATRHMAQWESALLEAEARLSRESLLFSSATSASASISHHSESSRSKPEPDFFLRIWNSEVGDAFRKPVSALRESAPPAGSSSTKQSTAATVSEMAAAKEEPSTESKSCVSGVVVGGGDGDKVAGVDSSGSYEVEDTSEESYQLYLDLGGDEMGLFSSHLGGFSLF